MCSTQRRYGRIAFIASVPGYVYAQRGDILWVNLFMASTADIKLDNGRALKLEQSTRYPWEGAVKIAVTPDQPAPLTINVRIPGWALNQPVASDLYQFADPAPGAVTLKVNGKPVAFRTEKGYAILTRTWKPGDTVELNLPMAVRRVVSNDQVAADRGRVALERGPIVYAAEWVDNPNGKVRNLMLPAASKLTAEFEPNLLNGVEVVKGRAVALAYDAAGKVQKTEQPFTAIPYYAWANRGKGQMLVWLPTSEASAKPTAYPTLATTAKVVVSGKPQHNINAIQDGETPASSHDATSYFDWWPRLGTAEGVTEWAEYDFQKPSAVSEAQLYWFDDTGRGSVRVPASWRLLYKDGDDWKPVKAAGPFGVEKDLFNRVAFEPVTTGALRVEVTMQPNFSVGIQKWIVK